MTSAAQLGPPGTRETVAAQLDGDRLTVSEVFRVGDQSWRHTFTVRRISDADLPAC